MKVCVGCRKELVCEKTGVGIDFGKGHVYAADVYRCPKCGVQIAFGNEVPHYDPLYKLHKEFVSMRQENDDEQ